MASLLSQERIHYRLLGAQEAASNSLNPGNLSLGCTPLVTVSPSSSSYLNVRRDGEGSADDILSGGRVMGGEPDLDEGMDAEKILGYAGVDATE